MTIYRRLTALRDKGLIRFRENTADRRIKFIEPTTSAQIYIEALERGLSRTLDAAV